MAYSYYTPMYQPYVTNPYQYQAQTMPQPSQPAQQTQNPSSILWVRNSQEAAMYPVAPNNAVALWDSGAPVIYLKQADAAGKPSMKTYDLVERMQKPAESEPAQGGDYATKGELAALAGVITDLREEVDEIKKKTPVKKEESDDE